MHDPVMVEEIRRQSAKARGRMKTALRNFPGCWTPSFSVAEYGANGPSLRIMLIRKGIGFTIYWRHNFKNPPTIDDLRKINYGIRRFKSGATAEIVAGIADLKGIGEELEEIIPLVHCAYRLSNPDKLIQMAAEGEWGRLRDGPARR